MHSVRDLVLDAPTCRIAGGCVVAVQLLPCQGGHEEWPNPISGASALNRSRVAAGDANLRWARYLFVLRFVCNGTRHATPAPWSSPVPQPAMSHFDTIATEPQVKEYLAPAQRSQHLSSLRKTAFSDLLSLLLWHAATQHERACTVSRRAFCRGLGGSRGQGQGAGCRKRISWLASS